MRTNLAIENYVSLDYWYLYAHFTSAVVILSFANVVLLQRRFMQYDFLNLRFLPINIDIHNSVVYELWNGTPGAFVKCVCTHYVTKPKKAYPLLSYFLTKIVKISYTEGFTEQLCKLGFTPIRWLNSGCLMQPVFWCV